MKKVFPITFLFSIVIFFACEKENIQKELIITRLNGYVQKGPFLNGTSISVFELSTNLDPTGKVFNTQIADNRGTFEMQNLNLSSQYAQIRADGFYYNEVKNENSVAQLTLYALTDLTNRSSLNVNVLSNLEKGRVSNLVQNGFDFMEAKQQAQREILSIFEIEKVDSVNSEDLYINVSGDDNAILLAVSIILQGNLKVSDLSQLMADISADISTDGILDDQSIGSALINNAKSIQVDQIRQNLITRYEKLGQGDTIPDFEKYVKQFIDSTDFEFTAGIKYPEAGKYGSNILDSIKTDYQTGVYSMSAFVPEGYQLKVKIQGTNWFYRVGQSNIGWERSEWNSADNSRTFTAVQTGDIDFEIRLEAIADSSLSQTNIFVYENEDIEPTWQKTIYVH